MAQFDLSNFTRLILSTEDDADSPVNEELTQTTREIIVGLLILMLDTGVSGAADSNPPNDNTGVLTDAAPGFVADVHNGRTLLITSGNAKGFIYTIDDTTASTIVCTGDNLYSDGVRAADTYKVLYDLKVNLDGHDHDGVNSKSVVLGDSVVTQAKLKTSMSSVNHSGDDTWSKETLPGGEYGFYPQIKGSNAGGNYFNAGIGDLSSTITLTTSYATVIHLYTSNSAYTIYAQQRYVTSSGEVFWIFILRDKVTKRIISMYQAPDHPCFGNGGKPLLVPHPFGSYDETRHEIIVINPTDEELAEMRAKQSQPEDTPDKDLLEVITEEYEIDESSKPTWPTKEVTVGLPPDWNEAWLSQTPVQPIKKVIPKVDYVMCRKLKPKMKEVSL